MRHDCEIIGSVRSRFCFFRGCRTVEIDQRDRFAFGLHGLGLWNSGLAAIGITVDDLCITIAHRGDAVDIKTGSDYGDPDVVAQRLVGTCTPNQIGGIVVAGPFLNELGESL